MRRPIRRVPGGRISLLALILAGSAAFLSGCGESTTVTLHEEVPDLGGDASLPDGAVTENRPPNPASSLELPCPFAEVEDRANNPFLQGVLGPDAIATIDEPKWVNVRNRQLVMFESEVVTVVEFEGIIRIFPTRIMLQHEIVNMCWDTASGPRYTYLTYCPLVDGYMHFTDDRACTAKNKYGVSGGVFNGNLIMFDRKTLRDSTVTMFVQLYAGGLNGSCAETDPMFVTMSWSMARKLYPNAVVLSVDTGVAPPGGYDLFEHPYTDYWNFSDPRDFGFAIEANDPRFAQMHRIYGLIGATERKAYQIRGATPYVANDMIDGTRVTVFVDPAFSAAAAYEAVHDGQDLTFSLVGREGKSLPIYRDEETGTLWNFEAIGLEGPLKGARLPRMMGFQVFWFAWSSLFPTTDTFRPPPSDS